MSNHRVPAAAEGVSRSNLRPGSRLVVSDILQELLSLLAVAAFVAAMTGALIAFA